MKEADISYLPADLKEEIIAALTAAQVDRITEYCNMSKVTGVTVKATYLGGHAEINITNSLGQGAATQLPENSSLSKILYKRVLG